MARSGPAPLVFFSLGLLSGGTVGFWASSFVSSGFTITEGLDGSNSGSGSRAGGFGNGGGTSVEFDKVLLLDNNGKVQVGTPTIKGAKISGKVVEHVKDGKVIIFKKKRRKGYALKNGHRQQFTKVQIESINA